MNKRITAIAVTVASLPLAALAAAAPATAAQPCDGLYPPGQGYVLHLSPTYLKVAKGARIQLGTRLIRGTYQCDNEKVGWYARGRTDSPHVFHLSRRGVTGEFDIRGGGLDYQNYLVQDDFRYFTNFVTGFTEQAVSPAGLVQTF